MMMVIWLLLSISLVRGTLMSMVMRNMLRKDMFSSAMMRLMNMVK